MKLKKVTALLLATSMVISSVNVAPIFADEYIEEASFGTTEEASAEVDLSDDFGVTEDASDEANTATEEEALFDEEITDEVVEDEEPVAEQVVTDEVAYEENADIYEALENAEAAGEDAAYTDYNIDFTEDEATITLDNSSFTYDGTKKTVLPTTATIVHNDNTYTITLDDGDYTISGNTATDAGKYEAEITIDKTVTGGSDTTYYRGTATAKWEIEGKTTLNTDYELKLYDGITDVTATYATGIVYDGEEHDLTELVKVLKKGTTTEIDTYEIDAESDYKESEVSGATPYTLKVKVDNYEGALTLDWNINKKVIDTKHMRIALVDENSEDAFVWDHTTSAVVEAGDVGLLFSNDDSNKDFSTYFKMVEVDDNGDYVADLPEGEYVFNPRDLASMTARVGKAYPGYIFDVQTVPSSKNYEITGTGFCWDILNYLPDETRTYDGTSYLNATTGVWSDLDFYTATLMDKGTVTWWKAGNDDEDAPDVDETVVTGTNWTAAYNYSQSSNFLADWQRSFVYAGTAELTYTLAGWPAGLTKTATVTTNRVEAKVWPVFAEDSYESGDTVTTTYEVGYETDEEDDDLTALIEKEDEFKDQVDYDVKRDGTAVTNNKGQFKVESGTYTVTPYITGVTNNHIDLTNFSIDFIAKEVPVKKIAVDQTWKVNGEVVKADKDGNYSVEVPYTGNAYTVTLEAKGLPTGYDVDAKEWKKTTVAESGDITANVIKADKTVDSEYGIVPLTLTITAQKVKPDWWYRALPDGEWKKANQTSSVDWNYEGYDLWALSEGVEPQEQYVDPAFITIVDEPKKLENGDIVFSATAELDDNYDWAPGADKTFSVTMKKSESAAIVLEAPATITYGQTADKAVYGDIVAYKDGVAYTSTALTTWLKANEEFITESLTGYTTTTEAGEHPGYVVVTVSSEAPKLTEEDKRAYTIVGSTSGTLTVNQASTRIVWDDIKTFTYDGQTHDFPHAVVYGLNDKVLKVATYFKDAKKTDPATEEIERGNYTVYIGELEDQNYVLPATGTSCAWSIYDDLSNLTAVYDSTMKYIKTPTDTTLEYQFATNVVPEGTGIIPTFWQKEIPGAINAGTYRVYYQTRKAGTNDAFGNTAYAVLKIAPKPVTATLKIEPIPVNGTLPTDLTVRDFEINGIEAVDSKNEFFAGSGFKTALEGYFISKAGTETRVANYYTITNTSGSYDVNFAKDADGNKYDNKSIIVHSKTVDGTTYSNYVVTAEKAAFTVGKVKVNIEWRVDDQKDYNTVEYRGTSHWVDAYIVSPAEYRGLSLDLMGDFSRTEVGTYTASITAAELKRFEIVSGGETFTWSITPKTLAVSTLMDKYNDGGLNVIAYGTADPTSTLGRNDLVFYGMNQITKKYDVPMTIFDYFDADDITGTPTFTTNYRQYNDVDMTGNLYHIDVDASALTAKNYKIVENQRAKLYVRKAQVTIVADNKNVGINATTMPKLTASFKDTVSGSKESAAAEHDFDAKVFTVEPTMDVYFPQTRGVYAIKVTGDDVNFTEPKRTYAELIAAGKPVNFEFQFTNGTYTVGEGDFEINLTDTRVAYDADPHTITGIPATLPNGIKIYFIDVEAKGFVAAKTAKAVFEANAALASVDRVYKKEVGTHNVYWHIDGKDYGYDSYGVNKITIISNAQSEAERVAKLIEEAVKEPVDPAKVAEARKEYDALSDAAKKHPAVGDAIKKLEAAEKTIADEAAKQIAALLPADPSKAVDTDRPNYEQAQGIYDALSDAEKALIPGSKTALDAAKKAIEADEAAKEKAFVDAVAALPAPADAKATDRAAVDAAKALYDALTAAEKADPAVKDAKAKLDLVDAAVKAAEEGEDADKAAAKKVADMIEALPAPEDVTVDDENAIKNAVDAFDALTEAQQALVPEADQEKLAADVLALAAAIVKEAEDQAAADDIEALIDAIATSAPGEGKAAMEAAKAAYEAATDDVRAKVDNGHKEVLDNAIECYKKDTTFNAGKGVYRVLSNGDVTYVKPLYPEETYFQVPNDVVCPEGFPFKVVKISVNAFKGCTNVTKIWMGKNIVTIGKYAFKGATNLRTLIVRTQDIDVTEKIENAFAGMAANRKGKVNVQIWEKMLSKYEPMFRGAGKLPAKAYFTTID